MDKTLKDLEDKYLNKKFKYNGINGVSNWTSSVSKIGYVTSCTKDGEMIKPYIINDIGVVYQLNEIIIIN